MTAPHGFKHRLIDWATLDTPMRRVIGFGFAVLLGLAGLTALHELLAGPSVNALTYLVPLPALIVAGLTIAAAVALMLAGAAAARSRWRFAGLLGIAGLCFALLQWRVAPDAEAAVPYALAATAVLALVSTALIAFGRRLNAWVVLALAAAGVAVTGALVLTPSLTAGATYGAAVVVILMIVIVVAALPAIVVVGWDLAEVAAEVGGAAVDALRRANEHAAAVFVIALGAALVLWLGYAHHLAPASLFYRAAALGLAALGFVWVLSRPRTAASHTKDAVGYFHVLFLGVAISLTMWAALSVKDDAKGAFNAHTGLEFSVVLPDGWQVVRDPEAGLPKIAANRAGRTHVDFAPQGRPGTPRMTVQAYPLSEKTRTPPAAIDVRLAGGEIVRLALAYPQGSDNLRGGSERFRDAAGANYAFDFVHRVVDEGGSVDGVYWYACLYLEAERARIEPACDAIALSFRFDARVAPSLEAQLFFNEIVWILLGLICLVVLVLWPSRAAAAIFFAWVAIVIAVRNAGASLGAHHDDIASEAGLSAGILAAALALGCVCALVAVVEAARSRAPHWAAARAQALSFLAALATATVFFEIYLRAAEASGHSNQIRGAIVCLALTWEFWTSGALVTNHDSARYPRAARIMFYLGYLLAVATIVFFWVEMPRAAGIAQKAFEPELYVTVGIACLGLPFLIYRHVRAALEARLTHCGGDRQV